MYRPHHLTAHFAALALATSACAPDVPDAGELASEGAVETQQASLIRFTGLGRSNRGYKLNEKAIVDTDLQMSEFFGSPFTISAWFMPEYTSCFYGPIFGESGGGYFVVGLGDYRKGDGGYKDAGSPVLYMKVGNKSAHYLAPGLVKHGWNQIAVVRTAPGRGGFHSFYLYLNGQRLYSMTNANGVIASAPEITFSDADPMTGGPQGHLRFGRRTSGQNLQSSQTWQYFGMLDDVAVYDVAKTSSQVLQMASDQRVDGDEADLLAGWTFDDFEPLSWGLLNPALKRPVTNTNTAYRIPLSWPRDVAADSFQFDNPFLVAPTTAHYKLPFPMNEVWRVVQPYDAPGGSHNGYAAFSIDFAKASGAAYAEVTASATGQIVEVNETYDPDPNNPREPYYVTIKGAEGEYAGYLHMAYGSFTEVFHGGTQYLFDPTYEYPFTWQAVSQGTEIAKVGPVAAHLHYGMTSHFGVSGQFPAAFEAYYASDDQGATWHYVYRGVPKAGQYLKRTQ